MKTLCKEIVLAAGMAAAVVVGGGGCDRGEDQVKVVQVPKEQRAPAQDQGGAGVGPGGMGGAGAPAVQPVVDQSGEQIAWDMPAGWVRKSETGQQMRVAAFEVDPSEPGALVTVVPLGGEAGSLLANVNRWEGQLGLPASSEGDLSKVTREIQTQAGPGVIVELEGKGGQGQSILAAIVKHGEMTWFMKLMGPTKLVQTQRNSFESFAKSTHFTQENPHQSEGFAAGSAAGGASGAGGAGAAASEGGLTYEAPAGWRKEGPRTMRVVSFMTGEGEKGAEVIVTELPTGAGDFAMNVDRWRGQVGLGPAEGAAADPAKMGQDVTVGGEKGRMYDFVGPEKRQIVVVVNQGGNDWFFKIIGPKDVVEGEKGAFEKFLGSVKMGG